MTLKDLKNKIPSLIPSHNNVQINQWQKVCEGLRPDVVVKNGYKYCNRTIMLL